MPPNPSIAGLLEPRTDPWALEADARYRREQDRILRWIGAILAAVVFEGALRKWALPGAAHAAAYVAKDALVACFLLRYPLPEPFLLLRRLRSGILLVAFLLLPAFFAGLAEISEAAIATYKNSFLWALFALHLSSRLEPNSLQRLAPFLSALTVAMSLLALFQYRSSPASWVNQYAWGPSYLPVVTFGPSDGVRATGTFSYIAGLTHFATFSSSLMLYWLLSGQSARDRLIALVGALAGIYCGVASGARASVLWFAVTLLMVLVLCRGAKTRARLTVLLLAATVLFGLAYRQGVVESFITRWITAPDTVAGRVTGEGLRGDYFGIIAENPFGIGLGQTTGYAAFHAMGSSGWGQLGFYDDGGTNAIVEAGYLGLLARIVTIVIALSLIGRALLSESYGFRLAGAALGIMNLVVIGTCIWYDHIGTALRWLSVGMFLSAEPGVASARRDSISTRLRASWGSGSGYGVGLGPPGRRLRPVCAARAAEVGEELRR